MSDLYPSIARASQGDNEQPSAVAASGGDMTQQGVAGNVGSLPAMAYVAMIVLLVIARYFWEKSA